MSGGREVRTTMRKVFVVGFHKTGTTSLRKALQILGHRVAGPDGVHDPDIAQTAAAMVARLSHEHDAFQDNPWPLFYAEMDAMWPDAKFILSLRDPDRWVASQVRHFGTKETPMRRFIYGDAHGCPAGNEAVYRARIVAHNDAVRAHFADRPDKLLPFAVEQGDGWEALCGFLGFPTPRQPFPHLNAARVREAPAPTSPLRTGLRAVKRAVKRLLP